ncbi:uncharacterized protein LOC127718631 [Mytilus californianus]|uniref:uncharacterized protein LOC127718631 n=1 Tax=Mytilus californianus TaxID=6549 RepID=UPI002247C377|nr:uncharacterized protein LOC127718631 [Mytilus californianus]
MIGVVIVFILRTVFKICQCNITTRGYTRADWRGRCCICRTKCYFATKLSIGISLIVLVIIIPYVSGLLENCCKDKEYFIIFGVCMVFMFVVCLLIPRTGEQNEQPADLETNIQQLLSRENEVEEKNKSEEEE